MYKVYLYKTKENNKYVYEKHEMIFDTEYEAIMAVFHNGEWLYDEASRFISEMMQSRRSLFLNEIDRDSASETLDDIYKIAYELKEQRIEEVNG